MTAIDTRTGLAGALDKWRICAGFADQHGRTSRDLQEFVLRAVAGVGSRSDDQVRAWEAHVSALPYRREPGDILREPTETMYVGGDCDDLACLFLAGCVALAIPAIPELLCDETTGDAYHIRVVVGLPPLNPAAWFVVDPVVWSERDWHAEPSMPGYRVVQIAESAAPAFPWMAVMIGAGVGWASAKLLRT